MHLHLFNNLVYYKLILLGHALFVPALAFTLHIYAYFIFITCRFNFSASSAATAVDIAIGNSRLSSSDRCNPLLLFWPGYPINKLLKQRQSHADTLTRSTKPTKQLQSVEYAANPPLDTSRYPDTHISRYPDTTELCDDIESYDNSRRQVEFD